MATTICITCEVVSEYVSLANKFTQDLSTTLITPMWVIFMALAGLWVVVHGIKMMVGQGDVAGLAKEFVYVMIAAVLMAGQGPGLVNQTYTTALSVMGGAASVVLDGGTVGKETGIVMADAPSASSGTSAAGIKNTDGMVRLVYTAEQGVYRVFQMAAAMADQMTMTDIMPGIYAVLMVAPYALVLIVYFAQVVVSIFRVMMFAALSPILMLGFGFGWGRGMAVTGLRTLFASFMVLFGATVAVAVCLYGVAALDIGTVDATGNVRDMMSIDNPKLIVVIMLGWLGTAFLAEATGMANSIAGSQLTNQAAAVITAGTVATGMALMKPQNYKKVAGAAGRFASGAGTAAMGAVDGLRYGAGAAMNLSGANQAAGSALLNIGKKISERLNVPTFDKD